MIDWWDNIIFAWRDALWGLLLIPILLAFALFRKDRRAILILSTAAFAQQPKQPGRVKWRPILMVLRLLAFALFIILLARPQSRIGWNRIPREGIDIMLSMDISPSMNAQDIPPNRLKVSQEEAQKFINLHPDDRIGIVVFSGETFTLSPLTTDHAALIELIDKIALGELDDGTSIGMGLAKAVERLEKSTAKSKVIILLTDGENNGGTISPLDAAQLAESLGIRLYTIGFCTDGEALQPSSRNPDGSFMQEFRRTDLDESQLRQMAEMTGGKYFRATNAEALEDVYSEISQLEKSTFDDKSGTEQRREEFLPFVLALLILLFTELLLRYTIFDTTT